MLVAMTACVQDELNPDALVPPQEEQKPGDEKPGDEKPGDETPGDETPGGETPEPAGPAIAFNEFYGAGEDNEKYIELYNLTDAEVSLEGYKIYKDEEYKDENDADAAAWVGTADLKIPAKGVYLILGAKGSTETGFNSGFSSKKSVKMELFDPEGTLIDAFQRGEKGEAWGDQSLTNWGGSWSRIPDGTGDFKMTETKTAGELNATEGVDDPDLVKVDISQPAPAPEPEPAGPAIAFNEFYGAGEDNEKYIELYNLTDAEVSLEGYKIYKDEEYKDENDADAAVWVGTADLKIPAKGVYLILGAKGTTETGFNSGFSSKKSVKMELFDPEGTLIDAFQRGEKGESWGGQSLTNWGGSWSRIPDGTGDFKMTETMTAGELNATEGVDDPDLKK